MTVAMARFDCGVLYPKHTERVVGEFAAIFTDFVPFGVTRRRRRPMHSLPENLSLNGIRSLQSTLYERRGPDKIGPFHTKLFEKKKKNIYI